MKNYSNNITGIMNCVKDCVQQAYNKGYKQGVADSQVEEKDKDHIWYNNKQYISLNRFLEAKAEAYKDGYNVGRVYREDADKKAENKPCVEEAIKRLKDMYKLKNCMAITPRDAEALVVAIDELEKSRQIIASIPLHEKKENN